MQIYLAATPKKLAAASRYTDHLAHVAYRIDSDGRLSRQDLLMRVRGGLMVIGDRDAGTIAEPRHLCQMIARECAERSYRGVVADFEDPIRQDKAELLSMLPRALCRSGRILLIPERYADAAPSAQVLICTAISGGSINARLEEAQQKYGPSRIALDLERLRMDFPLPCPTGEGRPLSGEELNALIVEQQPSVFFSHELGAKYFTYAKGGDSHFVLFDDADTLLNKAKKGHRMGVGLGFFMLPEIEDILPKLYPGKRQN